MKRLGIAVAVAAGAMVLAAPAFSQKDNEQGHGRAVVTILPAHSGEDMAKVSTQDLKIKVNGKDSSVTGFAHLTGPQSPLEIVVLIDGAARTSIGQQFNDISSFVKEMPADSKITFAYMENGRAVLAGPFSSNAAQVLNGLHMSAGSPGSNASPYFCLSDLAKNWPSKDPSARREVLMITDGVDNYDRRLDPDDPYVDAAINDSVRAGLVVYSIYWHDMGRMSSSAYATGAGQDLLQLVSQATGGNAYWEGNGNPVSFQPFLADLRSRFSHQYGLSFAASLKNKPEVETLKLELKVPSAKVEAPQRVLVAHGGSATGE
jgi:hypothetical protein